MITYHSAKENQNPNNLSGNHFSIQTNSSVKINKNDSVIKIKSIGNEISLLSNNQNINTENANNKDAENPLVIYLVEVRVTQNPGSIFLLIKLCGKHVLLIVLRLSLHKICMLPTFRIFLDR